MSGPRPNELAQLVAQDLANWSEGLGPVLEAVEGYRATLERHGYGDAHARAMAADYHSALLRMLVR